MIIDSTNPPCSTCGGYHYGTFCPTVTVSSGASIVVNPVGLPSHLRLELLRTLLDALTYRAINEMDKEIKALIENKIKELLLVLVP